MGQRFFISFNSRDREKAHWIAWTLRQAEHEVAVHDWEIPAGGNAPIWMAEKLSWADRLIAVVSPDYAAAAFSTMEWAATMWDDPTGQKGSVVPVLVRPTRKLPPLLRGLSRIDLTGVEEEEAAKLLVEGVEYPRAPLTKPAFDVVAPDPAEQGPSTKPEFATADAAQADSTTGNGSDPGRIRQPLSPMVYALMSLVALLLGAALLSMFVFWADELVQAGLEEKVFYVLLLPLGLCAAAFLFGAMNSYAVYWKKSTSGMLTLAGPVVVFVLVVVAGFQLVPKTTPFSVTVFVHEAENRANRLNTGTLRLTYGDLTRSGNIDENGMVTFTSIPRTYLKQEALFFLESQGYQLAEPRRQYILQQGAMYVPVKIQDALAMIVGSIWDESGLQSLGDVEVVVDGVSAKSDELGMFTLKLPTEKVKTKYNLLVRKAGYEPKRLDYWPNSGDMEVRLKKIE